MEATTVCPDDWTTHLRVLEEHNEQIVRTSIPFEYEPLDHPRLKRLREEYKLDDVVQGTQTELELMLRLAQWTCNYWDWPKHISECYPPWDALEILKPDRDKTPVGGFCLQFNLVFLQACESFGIPGRAISISQGRLQDKLPGGGHEIVELWSNEWKKWVYVDGALAWYIVDEKTGTPLSVWELRQRQLQMLRHEAAPRSAWWMPCGRETNSLGGRVCGPSRRIGILSCGSSRAVISSRRKPRCPSTRARLNGRGQAITCGQIPKCPPAICLAIALPGAAISSGR